MVYRNNTDTTSGQICNALIWTDLDSLSLPFLEGVVIYSHWLSPIFLLDAKVILFSIFL